MKRNTIKIVCSPLINKISYFFKNEMGEWLLLSENSELSRQYYTRTTIKSNGKDIIKKLDEIYNRKNKGLDLIFEGTSEEYECLEELIKKYLSDRDISCKNNQTKIVIVGKKSVGKTTLIEGIASAQGCKFEVYRKEKWIEYIDKYNNAHWIEIQGIDLGNENVSVTFSDINRWLYDGATKIVYCISESSGRIEETEINMINWFKNTFPAVDLIIVLTMCYKAEIRGDIDEIKKITGNENVFPVLAKDYKISNRVGGTISTFGLNELITFIFEGKRVAKDFFKNSYSTKEYKDNHLKRNINQVVESEKCNFQKVIVVGKKNVGKSTLIRECEKYINHIFDYDEKEDYSVYVDRNDLVEWYEIQGFDLRKSDVYKTFSILNNLQNITHMLYCISSENGRIEEIEKDFINRIKDKLPSIKITIVLTKCYKEESLDVEDELQRLVGSENIVKVLSQRYETRIKNSETGKNVVIPPYGIGQVYRKIRG